MKLEDIGVVVLSHGRRDKLEKSLKSYEENGLTNMVGDNFIFFNEVFSPQTMENIMSYNQLSVFIDGLCGWSTVWMSNDSLTVQITLSNKKGIQKSYVFGKENNGIFDFGAMKESIETDLKLWPTWSESSVFN